MNRNGLSDVYKRMYDDYRDTGLFSRDMLKRVSMVTGARYITQIELQGFQQGAHTAIEETTRNIIKKLP